MFINPKRNLTVKDKKHFKNTSNPTKSAITWLAFVSLSVGSLFYTVQAATTDSNTPVVIKGVVPSVSDKAELLEKLKAQYPNRIVRDEIEVRSNISIPTNWQEISTAIIDSDITTIRQGRIDINGTSIGLYGKVDSLEQKQAIQNRIHSRLTDLYQLDNQLVVTQGEQKLIDDTLGNRIVEFESGSANLTPKGLGILDDMANAIKDVGDKPITITGHTDNTGDPSANLLLSNQRAEAVKQYLIGRGIDASRLTTVGKGDTDPIASNDTQEGKTRNRRIEFTLGE